MNKLVLFVIATMLAISGSVLASKPALPSIQIPSPTPTPSPSESPSPSPTPSATPSPSPTVSPSPSPSPSESPSPNPSPSPTPTPSPSPDEYLPNDPKFDVNAARVTGVTGEYAAVKTFEASGQVKMSAAVVAVLDGWIDCGHLELKRPCLWEYAFNATDQTWFDSGFHGMGSVGTGFADTDNHMGVASTGGLSPRLTFFPVKICHENFCKGEWLQAALEYVLQVKRSGVPVVAIACNVASGVVDPVAMDKLMKELDAEQIDIIAPGPNNIPAVNIDEFNTFPASYTDRYPNIISVTATDASGLRLTPASAYGPKRMNLAAPGDSVKTISILDPANGSASISGASAVTNPVAALYGLIRIYRDSTSAGARFILKYTARMSDELEGKLNASSGSSNDTGRMAGVINARDALNLPFGCPAPSAAVMWVTARDSNRLVAVSTPLMTQGPFSLKAVQNSLNPDGLSRVTLFAYNIGTIAGAIHVVAKDSTGKSVELPVEAVNALANPLSCVSQVNVVLTTQPALSAGDVILKITVNNQSSGEGIITIKP